MNMYHVTYKRNNTNFEVLNIVARRPEVAIAEAHAYLKKHLWDCEVVKAELKHEIHRVAR